MNRQDESDLNRAIESLRADLPEADELARAGSRVAGRLDIVPNADASAQIANCSDVRNLMAGYRSGELSEGKRILVQTHLTECGACLLHYRQGSQAAVIDWSSPRPTASTIRASRNWGWALAAMLLLCAGGLLGYRMFLAVPPGVRAEVQSIDGAAYLVSSGSDRQILAGESIQEGDRLRTAGGSRAVLRLSDGSTLEVNERTALHIGARGRNTTVWLDRGAAIVQAAHRTTGHLYLRTPDCRVAVTGTVFSVDAGLKGSRVSVLQGAVHVTHAGKESILSPGDQVTTDENLVSVPLEQEVAWGKDRDKYLALVAQVALLAHRVSEIPLPQARYSSDLLDRMPADTLLYVSIPNLGDFVSQANAIFKDQLAQSPELQEWWERDGDRNTVQLDQFVTRLHDLSQYIGDEMVVAAMKDGDRPGLAILADVQKSGIADVLRQDFGTSGMVLYSDESLAATKESDTFGQYALVRDREVVFSNSLVTLKRIDAQLKSGASGFATGEFGKQIQAAYGRGAGIILAADLHGIMLTRPARAGAHQAHRAEIENSGLDKVQFLIAEHRESNNLPQNHINLQFAGTRERMASWLAAPAAMGSLDFVTPNASIAVAGLTKDPSAIADDIIAMSTDGQDTQEKLAMAEQMLQVNVRQDILANLGGEFLLTLDGPVLPAPSWKAVIEVRDAPRLEYALEKLVAAINTQSKQTRQITIEPSEVDGQKFYAVRETASASVLGNYTYSGGYMIVAANRALLMDALKAASSGNSLGRSTAFRALLPKDQNENYSAVAYQNLSPVINPLLSQFSGDAADALRKLAADSHPTAVCAWGEENRIEAGSDSRLFGFDFLTLGALLNSRNHTFPNHVIH